MDLEANVTPVPCISDEVNVCCLDTRKDVRSGLVVASRLVLPKSQMFLKHARFHLNHATKYVHTRGLFPRKRSVARKDVLGRVERPGGLYKCGYRCRWPRVIGKRRANL